MTRSRDVADVQENLGGAVPPFAAGKNKIINGDFGVWQRGTSFSNPATTTYNADRNRVGVITGTPTTYLIDRQTFTPGTAPVAGYEGQYFLRSTITDVGTMTAFGPVQQFIEDVRTFAGQTVTLSFWAKADSNRNSIVFLTQSFGAGGSTAVNTSTPTLSATTSWARYSFTYTLPSISGKTIGTNSSLVVSIRQACASGSVLDVWGLQLEAGSTATAFQTATGTIEGELAACQRYYWRSTSSSGSQTALGIFGTILTTTTAQVYLRLNTPMRVTPTAADFSTIGIEGTTTALTAVSNITIQGQSTNDCVGLEITSTGLTASTFATLRGRAGTAFLGLSAEL
jgi:hypothetical protein